MTLYPLAFLTGVNFDGVFAYDGIKDVFNIRGNVVDFLDFFVDLSMRSVAPYVLTRGSCFLFEVVIIWENPSNRKS